MKLKITVFPLIFLLLTVIGFGFPFFQFKSYQQLSNLASDVGKVESNFIRLQSLTNDFDARNVQEFSRQFDEVTNQLQALRRHKR